MPILGTCVSRKTKNTSLAAICNDPIKILKNIVLSSRPNILRTSKLLKKHNLQNGFSCFELKKTFKELFLRQAPELKPQLVELENDLSIQAKWLEYGLEERHLKHFEDAKWLYQTGLAMAVATFANSDITSPKLESSKEGLQILVEGEYRTIREVKERFSAEERNVFERNYTYFQDKVTGQEYYYISPNGLSPTERFNHTAKLKPIHVLSERKHQKLLRKAQKPTPPTDDTPCIVIPFVKAESLHTGFFIIDEKRQVYSTGFMPDLNEQDRYDTLNPRCAPNELSLTSGNGFMGTMYQDVYLSPKETRVSTLLLTTSENCQKLLDGLSKQEYFRFNRAQCNCRSVALGFLKEAKLVDIDISRPLRNRLHPYRVFNALPTRLQNLITNISVRIFNAGKGIKLIDQSHPFSLIDTFPNITDKILYKDPKLLLRWMLDQRSTFVSFEDRICLGLTLPKEDQSSQIEDLKNTLT